MNRRRLLSDDKTNFWMGLGLFVVGLLIVAAVLLGSFDWTTLVLGAIPTVIGGWLMVK